MLKICGNSVLPPFQLIFKSCLESCAFPSEWKKANVVPEHKKGDKQSLKNYRPISILAIYGKIFERLIYNKMLEYFIENNLISPNKSGLNVEIHVLTCCYLLHMMFINLLMKAMRLEA